MHASGSFCGEKKKLKHLGPRLSEQIELAVGLWLPYPASVIHSNQIINKASEPHNMHKESIKLWIMNRIHS